MTNVDPYTNLYHEFEKLQKYRKIFLHDLCENSFSNLLFKSSHRVGQLSVKIA
jgi:hypothetical protein